jgi:hypothetical protein
VTCRFLQLDGRASEFQPLKGIDEPQIAEEEGAHLQSWKISVGRGELVPREVPKQSTEPQIKTTGKGPRASQVSRPRILSHVSGER